MVGTQSISAENFATHIWNTTTGELLITYTAHDTFSDQVVWSPAGQYIASTSADGAIHIWDATNGQTVETVIQAGDRPVVDWRPDGNQLVYGVANGVPHFLVVP